MSVKRLTRATARNQEEQYKETFRKRGVKYIDQYPTAILNHPTPEQIALNVQMVGHTWKVGDRYSKLAHRFYGDAELWWVIAWFNQLPTDSHVSLGQTIHIPMPLHKILAILRGE